MDSRQSSDRFQRLRSLAWFLDSSIPLPGGFRVGLDALIGLIPGVGDAAGAAISAYIVNEARLLGAPPSILWRMAANILVEAILGSVPVAGDLFDAAFKANLRNVALVESYQLNPKRSVRRSRLFMVGFTVALLLLIALVVAIPVLVIVAVVKLI